MTLAAAAVELHWEPLWMELAWKKSKWKRRPCYLVLSVLQMRRTFSVETYDLTWASVHLVDPWAAVEDVVVAWAFPVAAHEVGALVAYRDDP